MSHAPLPKEDTMHLLGTCAWSLIGGFYLLSVGWMLFELYRALPDDDQDHQSH